MKKKYQNKKYLIYVTQLPCILHSYGFYSCSGPTQAHHLLKPWDGVRGMSLRANDKNVIPLCMKHHHELHTKHGTEKNFFENFGLKAETGQIFSKKLYENNSSFF